MIGKQSTCVQEITGHSCMHHLVTEGKRTCSKRVLKETFLSSHVMLLTKVGYGNLDKAQVNDQNLYGIERVKS
jgi:hypothetical protein